MALGEEGGPSGGQNITKAHGKMPPPVKKASSLKTRDAAAKKDKGGLGVGLSLNMR